MSRSFHVGYTDILIACTAPFPSGRLLVQAYRTPFFRAIPRARRGESSGVGGWSNIRKSGWNAVPCTGTSGPRLSTLHRVIPSGSSSPSFSGGMSNVMISSRVRLRPRTPAPRFLDRMRNVLRRRRLRRRVLLA